jgi:hypothetical protein
MAVLFTGKKSTDVSDDYIASIIRVEKCAKHEANVKAGDKQSRILRAQAQLCKQII